ncbi:TPA: hypothetical protein TXT54_001628 [Streptococcus suis]|nr:hypothetical protein [Streptococcus suis]
MDYNLNQKINCEQNGVFYDPDSSRLTWEYYKDVYKEFKLYDDFYFEEPEYAKWTGYGYIDEPDNQSNSNRLYVFAKRGEQFKSNNHIFRLGGETDFNFNKMKFLALKRIANYDLKIIKKLQKCQEYHHTFVNFSIMPATGNMQKVKSLGYNNDKLDRLDSFIAIIDDYYSKRDSIKIFSQAGNNIEPLEQYLTNFFDVYEYCREIYFLQDKDLVNELKKSGKNELSNQKDVERYVELANEFWHQKEKILRRQNDQSLFPSRDGGYLE